MYRTFGALLLLMKFSCSCFAFSLGMFAICVIVLVSDHYGGLMYMSVMGFARVNTLSDVKTDPTDDLKAQNRLD